MTVRSSEQPNTTLVVGNFKRGQENWTKRHCMSFSTDNESMEKHLKPCTHSTGLRNSNSGKFLEYKTDTDKLE